MTIKVKRSELLLVGVGAFLSTLTFYFLGEGGEEDAHLLASVPMPLNGMHREKNAQAKSAVEEFSKLRFSIFADV